MKKSVWTISCILFFAAASTGAAELKVGDRAPDFTLKDSTGKDYTMETPPYKGKVISVFYVDPDEKDLNLHLEDALQTDPGLERDKNYKGLGIADLKSTIKPNFILKVIVKNKQEKTGAIVLLDYDWTVLNLWGMAKDSSTVVILDKERICRYIYKGRIPGEDIPKIIQIIKDYQSK